jgi:hypothetical protein
VIDLEFAVLFLRICSYASQFLPSPSYTVEKIKDMSLLNIRNACDNTGDRLSMTCARFDAADSLLRVQHLSYAGLISRCESRTKVSSDILENAIQVAQRAGIGRDARTHEIEKETHRRVFCNAYIWDR